VLGPPWQKGLSGAFLGFSSRVCLNSSVKTVCWGFFRPTIARRILRMVAGCALLYPKSLFCYLPTVLL
jgi:hypothetical protein